MEANEEENNKATGLITKYNELNPKDQMKFMNATGLKQVSERKSYDSGVCIEAENKKAMYTTWIFELLLESRLFEKHSLERNIEYLKENNFGSKHQYASFSRIGCNVHFSLKELNHWDVNHLMRVNFHQGAILAIEVAKSRVLSKNGRESGLTIFLRETILEDIGTCIFIWPGYFEVRNYLSFGRYQAKSKISEGHGFLYPEPI